MDIEPIINAAGKLTALGGSAQSEAVAGAQAEMARRHVDLADLRRLAGERIAAWTGAEAACVTSGAASAVTIGIAAIVTGNNLYRVQQLPATDRPHKIALQAGHAVNFGAEIRQLIRMAGAEPLVIGATNQVTERLLADTIAVDPPSALLFVQSHHCVQDNMIRLEDYLRVGHAHGLPVMVDAAAEDDLHYYIEAGADLVAYSGGKAFGGPTSGFIVGKVKYIDACELQFRGIARTMKIGKEGIAGLLTALEEYVTTSDEARKRELDESNRRLMDLVKDCTTFQASLKADEAGRDFCRVAIRTGDGIGIRELVSFLAGGRPGIRTRNHHIDQGYVLIDPRELQPSHIEVIADRLRAFDAERR